MENGNGRPQPGRATHGERFELNSNETWLELIMGAELEQRTEPAAAKTKPNIQPNPAPRSTKQGMQKKIGLRSGGEVRHRTEITGGGENEPGTNQWRQNENGSGSKWSPQPHADAEERSHENGNQGHAL
jgi:hypothetical protein